ncbi:hypothetical protein Taro_016145, partial [Colocasia esculenta]|nr:hypothetical protein [Colocasia esculenta]
DCSALVSDVALLPHSLRCAVGSAGAFWRVFLERCLGGSGECAVWLGRVLVRFSSDGSWHFLVESAWAFSVKVLCAWSCVWLLRWPACLVSRFQVSRLCWWDFVCPRGSSGLFCSCARRALADGGLVSVVALDWLCFVWKCQSRVVVLPLACGRDSCVSPSSAFRRLLGVVMLHCSVVLPRCASL